MQFEFIFSELCVQKQYLNKKIFIFVREIFSQDNIYLLKNPGLMKNNNVNFLFFFNLI